MSKLQIVTVHGESRSLFHVIENNPHDAGDWQVLRTFKTREEAETYKRAMEYSSKEG